MSWFQLQQSWVTVARAGWVKTENKWVAPNLQQHIRLLYKQKGHLYLSVHENWEGLIKFDVKILWKPTPPKYLFAGLCVGNRGLSLFSVTNPPHGVWLEPQQWVTTATTHICRLNHTPTKNLPVLTATTHMLSKPHTYQKPPSNHPQFNESHLNQQHPQHWGWPELQQ